MTRWYSIVNDGPPCLSGNRKNETPRGENWFHLEVFLFLLLARSLRLCSTNLKTHRPLGRFRALSDDLQGCGYRGPSQVPILPWIVVIQKLQQAWHVHVIIVVEVAEPPETESGYRSI